MRSKLIAVAAFPAAVLWPSAGMPSAAAQPCPDVEVVFARGTGEPPGVGGVGRTFVDALRADAATRSVDVYGVDYPASTDFPAGAQGVTDAVDHLRTTAANCPLTRMVLGGYSQGAAVIGLATSGAAPEVADHVAAVVLFGKPSPDVMASIGAPPATVGPRYADRTLELCAAGDHICTQDGGGNSIAHVMYGMNGMAAQGAEFAARRL
jgi:cutinase